MNPADNVVPNRDSGTAQVIALPAEVGCLGCATLWQEVCRLRRQVAYSDRHRVALTVALMDAQVEAESLRRQVEQALAAVALLDTPQPEETT